jgi:cytochrome c biogenesis protein CcdA
VVGVGLTITAIWLLATGSTFGILEAGRVQARLGSGVKDVLLFGVGYGVCSLSCTLPIFLVVVGTALATGGVLYGLTQFVSYGLGMGLVLAVVTVSAALFREAFASRLRRLVPHVHRISALFMLGAGLYIVYYWVVLGRVLG